jgi:hypothetical protein
MASIISAGTTSATALNMSADTSGVLQLASNNGTVALTVTAAQRIGIGITTPGYLLDVQGAAGNATPITSLVASSLTNPGAQNWATLAFAPTMTSGATFSHWIGRTNATADSGYIGYVYAGTTGSNNSRVAIGTFNNDNALNVYHGGWVTMPRQPAFTATGIGTVFTTSSWAVLPFSTEVFDNNGNYTPASSRFTAPVAGVYQFSWSVLHRFTTSGARTAIYKNGAKVYDPGNANSSQTYNSVNSETTIGASYILSLAANDYVEIYGIVGSGIGDLYLSANSHNQFTGFLIG